MEYQYHRAGERRTCLEMRQKPLARDTFFSLKSDPQADRPSSVATEFVDTDFDEEDSISDAGDTSPRVSLQSSGGQPSITTISSYDEAVTPRSSRSREAYLELSQKPVEGPRGPHLFRSSTVPSLPLPEAPFQHDDDIILTLSPITPKVSRGLTPFQTPRRNTPFRYARDELDASVLASWTPEMVAQSMLNAGVELSIADRFVENDINGAILITLKFEDLRELDISSFGIRTRIWHQIQALRDSRPTSPRPATPIEDAPSREARRESRQDEASLLKRRPSSSKQRRRRPSADANDIITPAESVSIIGIEQVLPKPHNCSKGENCSKWRKQQRLLDEFRRAGSTAEIRAGGTVMVHGGSGNPETARAIDPHRPMSDAVPSVVASSDVLGPGGLPPLQYLQEATLRGMQARDPQDNVRQFLSFQHQQAKTGGEDLVPPTPPFEVHPPPQPPHHRLRRLPRLSIPDRSRTPRAAPPRAATVPPPTQQQQYVEEVEFTPYLMDKGEAVSPDLETPKNPYRFGTPFSEMDVPLTAIPIGPVARDVSQSVPPDMNYRSSPHSNSNSNPSPPRCQSRGSRRPSFSVLPALDENKPVRIPAQATSPRASIRPGQQQPLQAPPRTNYPWSPAEPRRNPERAIPPHISRFQPWDAAGPMLPTSSSNSSSINGVTHQGPMKKRKTRMLRHEWQDGYFTLRGSRLNMHRDERAVGRTLEYVDIDDYAIACSSLASQSKLSAAFRAVAFTSNHSREKSDPVGAFAFQLIPQDKERPGGGARLRKRDSALPAAQQSAGGAASEGVNGTGKTHHFAVKNRDDRIDWMRELMLAKALKQKGDGFEVNVNGNMI